MAAERKIPLKFPIKFRFWKKQYRRFKGGKTLPAPVIL